MHPTDKAARIAGAVYLSMVVTVIKGPKVQSRLIHQWRFRSADG
jgi:hypothetical protein